MNFKDLKLKKSYDSDSDDILKDFYIPVLSNAVSYKRLAGYFSSSSLAVAAKGIARFISHGGKMQLVTGAVLQKADIGAIEKANKDPEKIIEELILKDLEQLEMGFIKDHVATLGWMIANKRLEIKIAILTNETRGIFHQKVGILEDDKGNKLSFSGSDNESAAAWKDNIEEFKLFRNWKDDEKEYFETDDKKFNKFWSGSAQRVKIIEISEAIKQKLIEIAPKDIKKLDLKKYYISKEIIKIKKKVIKLRPYQQKAIKKWFKNNRKGIFEMATGTGKTFTALGCLKELYKSDKKNITVISCPYGHLVKQWKNELNKFNITENNLIADSSNPNWKNILTDSILDIKNNLNERLIILTTHDTFSSNVFINIIKTSSTKLFLITDEVHSVGASKRRKGLLNEYLYRLGLSATPSRWFDDEGTKKLFKYFGCQVEPKLKATYEFSLKKAITTINPDTKQTYLTPYYYNPYFIELTKEETEEYIEQTSKILKYYQVAKNNKEREKYYSLLLIKRQNIIVNAIEKLNTFDNIIDKLKSQKDGLRFCLVYCSPKQIKEAQKILNTKRIMQHKFTNWEGNVFSNKYQGQSEREHLIKEFSKGNYEVLVAMKCLDEGVDIPPARIAIILASSGNPKEYIQRRGRILRRYPGKEHSIIYDILVFPKINSRLPSDILLIEKKIIRKELKRYNEFAGISINKLECLNKISDITINLLNK